MSNVITARAVIKGVRPLLWHRFGPDALPLQKRERTGVAGNDPEEWRTRVLVTREGQLYLEPSYIFSALRDGARFTKKGRGSIQFAVAATLEVTDDRILVDRWLPGFPNGHECDVMKVDPPATDSSQPVYLDVRGVRNPGTKAHNVRYRIAASPGWTCSFTVLWDRTIVSRGELEAVLHDTGRFCGLGNGRTIGMGRFEVVSFEVHEDQ